MIEELRWVVSWALALVILGPIAAVVAYAIFRSAALAYYRTKYENLRRTLRELKKGDQ